MEKKIICSCPKCKKDLIEGKYSYECECGFKCSKEIWCVSINEELMKNISEGKTTDLFTFKKPDKEWSARLKYSESEGKVIFDFEKKSEVIGTCPCCKGNVKNTEKYFICENYKQSCEFILSKEISGQLLSKEEAIKLLNGEVLPAKEYSWKSGKKSFAKLKLKDNGKLDFQFE